MKYVSFIAIIMMACTLYACDATADQKPVGFEVQEIRLEENKMAEQVATDTATIPAAPPPKQEEPRTQKEKFVDWDKKIIKTGSLSIEVKDYARYRQQLSAFIKSHEAYIASEQETQTDERKENRLTIKVPVHRFQELMDELNKAGEKIINKEISSQDVTTEVVDTKSRIEAKKKIRQRYIDLLQQAKSMEDILNIQSQINEVQEQIEMAEGRMGYLNHSSAYSTIHLHYYLILKEPVTGAEPSFSNRLVMAFETGWEVIKVGLIALITLWPLWLVGIAVLLYFKKRKAVVIKA